MSLPPSAFRHFLLLRQAELGITVIESAIVEYFLYLTREGGPGFGKIVRRVGHTQTQGHQSGVGQPGETPLIQLTSLFWPVFF